MIARLDLLGRRTGRHLHAGRPVRRRCDRHRRHRRSPSTPARWATSSTPLTCRRRRPTRPVEQHRRRQHRLGGQRRPRHRQVPRGSGGGGPAGHLHPRGAQQRSVGGRRPRHRPRRAAGRDDVRVGDAGPAGSAPGRASRSLHPRRRAWRRNAAAPDITLVANVAPDAGPATLINIADVTGPDTDVDPDNNTDHDPTVIVDQRQHLADQDHHRRQPGQCRRHHGIHDRRTQRRALGRRRGHRDRRAARRAQPRSRQRAPGGPARGDTVVQCDRDTVAAGTDAPAIVVTVRVGSGVPDGTTITNTADTSTSTPGDNPADNSDERDRRRPRERRPEPDQDPPRRGRARGRPGHLRPRRRPTTDPPTRWPRSRSSTSSRSA